MQELGDTAPFVNSNESGLKRRCIVMLELSATLARVLEFLTSKLPELFLSGPPLNLSRYRHFLSCTGVCPREGGKTERSVAAWIQLLMTYCEPCLARVSSAAFLCCFCEGS